MPLSIGHRKVQINTYRQTPQQYSYLHCQLSDVPRSHALLLSVCIFMLPMLGLADKHAQLTITYRMSPIHQFHVCSRHMAFSHAPLVLTSLNNVLPAMVLQSRVERSNIRCPSSHSNASSAPIILYPVPQLGGRAMEMVVVLLLLMSGDVELNPGPVGEYMSLCCCHIRSSSM